MSLYSTCSQARLTGRLGGNSYDILGGARTLSRAVPLQRLFFLLAFSLYARVDHFFYTNNMSKQFARPGESFDHFIFLKLVAGLFSFSESAVAFFYQVFAYVYA